MECTMPTACFTPRDNVKTLEYIANCLDEAYRGLSFVNKDTALNVKKLKMNIADACAEVTDALRYA